MIADADMGLITDSAREQIMERMALLDLPTFPDLPAPDVVIEEIERRHKEAKRQRHISYCGEYARRTCPEDGSSFYYEWTCGYWRLCARCFGERVDGIRERLDRISIQVEEIGIAEISEAQATKITRYLRDNGNEYVRYPIMGEDGNISVILIYDAHDIERDRIPESELTMSDLEEGILANTPEGKRWSGSLGRKEEEEEEVTGEEIIVSVHEVIVKDLPRSEQEEAWQEALQDTRDLDPNFDPEEISYACWLRIKAYKKRIIERGGEIAAERSARVKLSDSVFTSWKSKILNDEQVQKGHDLATKIDAEMASFMAKIGLEMEQTSF